MFKNITQLGTECNWLVHKLKALASAVVGTGIEIAPAANSDPVAIKLLNVCS